MTLPLVGPLLDNKILILILINRNFFKWQKYVNFKPESDEILILRCSDSFLLNLKLRLKTNVLGSGLVMSLNFKIYLKGAILVYMWCNG